MRTFLVLAMLLPLQALAWGPTGHRVAGEIAARYLSKKAQREITELLGNESLAMAGTWADFVRSDPGYDYAAPWHYINVPDSLDYESFSATVESLSSSNAYNALMQMRKKLDDASTPREEKIVALKFIVHIIADIHQPLHVGRAEDLGGNRVEMRWFGQSTNLHRVWDEHLVDFQQLSYTEMAAAYNNASREQVLNWQGEEVMKWFFESYLISRDLYAQADKNGNLSYRYNFDHLETLQQRLLQAGVRLAGFLNDIFR